MVEEEFQVEYISLNFKQAIILGQENDIAENRSNIFLSTKS
jgi:hypothetical protein